MYKVNYEFVFQCSNFNIYCTSRFIIPYRLELNVYSAKREGIMKRTVK